MHRTLNAVALMHAINESPGTFESLLQAHGIIITHLHAFLDDFEDFDPLLPDLLIVMGGAMGVYQSGFYPFLDKEIAMLKKRIESDKPTLGICLGAQLIARALGANVYPGDKGQEIGWKPVTVTREGMETPARHFDSAITSMFHSHGDTFDLPRGATLLASSDAYPNQIFRYGRNIWALQCHPEMDRDSALGWAANMPDHFTNDSGEAIAAYRQDTERYAATLERQASRFVHDWLKETGLLGEGA